METNQHSFRRLNLVTPLKRTASVLLFRQVSRLVSHNFDGIIESIENVPQGIYAFVACVAKHVIGEFIFQPYWLSVGPFFPLTGDGQVNDARVYVITDSIEGDRSVGQFLSIGNEVLEINVLGI